MGGGFLPSIVARLDSCPGVAVIARRIEHDVGSDPPARQPVAAGGDSGMTT
jgi:hypothetical protein